MHNPMIKIVFVVFTIYITSLLYIKYEYDRSYRHYFL
jgi:hypothetical protein